MSFQKEKLASLSIRIGLAAVFLYIAYASFVQPDTWLTFLPSFLQNLPYAKTILYVFSFYQILLSLWLLSGKKRFYAAILTSLTLAGIVISTLKFLDIAFRDIAILFAALALVALHWKE
jgi:uncharacterized membrane protein YphA (DoxX/SURF4 family)